MTDETTLQINEEFTTAKTDFEIGGVMLSVCPPLDADYWALRVPVTDGQAIVAFPKFSTYGIGFQHEKADWNCNLPYTCDADMIYKHISHNKGDDSISEADCIQAITTIQDAIKSGVLGGE